MALEYIQIFADMEELFEPYDDAQIGRLMMAMMAYAYRGEQPEFDGAEKYIWTVLRQHIDRCAASVEAKKSAGSKGGKKQAEESTPKQNEAEPSKAKQTQANASRAKQSEAEPSKAKQNAHKHDHEHDHEQDHKQEQKENDARAMRATAAPAAAKEDAPIIGIDGTDLSAAIADYDRAGEVVTRYRLPDTDQSREAVLLDAKDHGWEKVEAALKEASLGNSRAMLSVNFYRAILKNAGKPKMSRSRAAPAGDSMLRYTPEQRRETFGAAILDFDEEEASG